MSSSSVGKFRGRVNPIPYSLKLCFEKARSKIWRYNSWKLIILETVEYCFAKMSLAVVIQTLSVSSYTRHSVLDLAHTGRAMAVRSDFVPGFTRSHVAVAASQDGLFLEWPGKPAVLSEARTKLAT